MIGVDIEDYYCCGTCHWWQGRIGEQGNCTIPASPSTVNCGETTWTAGCEQWIACENYDTREQHVRDLRKVAYLKRHATHRAQWWRDRALNGPDPRPG